MTTPATEFEVVDLLIERLKTGQPGPDELHSVRAKIASPYVAVYGALDVAGIRPDLLKSPAAIVLPLTEDAAESDAAQTAPSPQYTRMIIAVETMVKAPNDPSGRAETREVLKNTIGAARNLIVGWRPMRPVLNAAGVPTGEEERIPGVNQALQLERGRLTDISGPWVSWRDDYLLRWWHFGGRGDSGDPNIPARMRG